MFLCFARSLRKSAGIVLMTGFFGCVIYWGSWMSAIGMIHWVGHQVFAYLDLLFIIYCLFAAGVVRLVWLVVSVATVTASLILL